MISVMILTFSSLKDEFGANRPTWEANVLFYARAVDVFFLLFYQRERPTFEESKSESAVLPAAPPP